MADVWVQHFTIKASHVASQTIFSFFFKVMYLKGSASNLQYKEALLKVSGFLIMTFFYLFNCNSSLYQSNKPANTLQVTGPKS